MTTLITTTRTPTTGSIANNQPKSSKFETVPDMNILKATQLDPYYDYIIVPTSSDLDSLDLVTSIDVDNIRSYRTRPPKRISKLSSKNPTRRKKPIMADDVGCEGDELCEIKSETSDTKSERNHTKKLLQNEMEIATSKLTEHLSPNDAESSFETKKHSFRRHSHEDYEIDCDSPEHNSVEIFPSTEQPANLIRIGDSIDSTKFDITTDTPHNSPTPISSKKSIASTEKAIEISTEKSLETSTTPTTKMMLSLRRMSESEEISTECDSVEEHLLSASTMLPLSPTIETSIDTKTIPRYKSTPSASISPNYLATSISSTPGKMKSTNTNNHKDKTTTLNTASMRRMSESEEIVTDCGSDEDKISTNIAETASEKSFIKTHSSSPMTINHSAQTDLPIATTTPTATTYLTTSKLKTTTTNELSKRISESGEDCESKENTQSSKEIDSSTQRPQLSTTFATTSKNDKNSTDASLLLQSVVPITDSMRRMSESDENSSDCDSHEDIIVSTTVAQSTSDSHEDIIVSTTVAPSTSDLHENIVVLTTIAPSRSDSMRRMSQINDIDILTTELDFEDLTNPTNPTVDLPEYVTECDTEIPLITEALNESLQESQNDVKNISKIGEISPLPCCPNPVCLLLYPNSPTCDVRRTNTPVVDISNFTSRTDELRNMFYLYKTQVLITKMLSDSDYIKKRNIYEQYLVNLWNETIFTYQINNSNSCTNSLSNENAKETISSIYCFLNYTDNLLNESFVNMILEVVKRIETDFPNKKIVKYPKLRRIILLSLPKILNESDAVYLLSDYMKHNRNRDKERVFLLQLLLDIQERFEMEMKNNSIEMDEKSANNQISKDVTDSSESLQENGIGIKMHPK